jgi:hypothetical protein
MTRCNANAFARQFRRQAAAPELGQEAVADFDHRLAFDRKAPKSAAAGEAARGKIARGPKSEAEFAPVIDVLL